MNCKYCDQINGAKEAIITLNIVYLYIIYQVYNYVQNVKGEGTNKIILIFIFRYNTETTAYTSSGLQIVATFMVWEITFDQSEWGPWNKVADVLSWNEKPLGHFLNR